MSRIPWWDRFADQNAGKYIIPMKICWRSDEYIEKPTVKPIEKSDYDSRLEGEPEKNSYTWQLYRRQIEQAEQNTYEQDTYERQLYEQQIYERQQLEQAEQKRLQDEQDTYEQQLYEQQLYEQQLYEQRQLEEEYDDYNDDELPSFSSVNADLKNSKIGNKLHDDIIDDY